MSTTFEPGAPAAEGQIPLCVPEIRGNEWEYIKTCLDTNFISSVGPFVQKFEQMLADYAGTQHAVAVVNGTSGLHIALLVAGVEPGDEVLVSTLTFIAPVNAIRYAGAWPVFIDAEPEYWQIDPQKIEDFLEKDCEWKGGTLYNRHTGRRVRALLPVHILGHPFDADAIQELAQKYNLALIDDATESLGAKYKGKKVGSFGDIIVFSFNGNKIISTGGGGMIVTNRSDWAKKARYLTTQAKDDPLEYIHNEIGYNYRLTNVLAALGCAQMEKLDEYVFIKRRIAQTYKDAFSDVRGLRTMKEANWAFSTFWLYTVLVNPAEYGMDSRTLLRKLQAAGIQSRPLWQPVHLSPAHRGAYFGDCSVAERLNQQALSLPSSVGLTQAQQLVVIDLMRSR